MSAWVDLRSTAHALRCGFRPGFGGAYVHGGRSFSGIIAVMFETEPSGRPLVTLGVFLLVGYAAHVLGQKAHVPRVTLLLRLGPWRGPLGSRSCPRR